MQTELTARWTALVETLLRTVILLPRDLGDATREDDAAGHAHQFALAHRTTPASRSYCLHRFRFYRFLEEDGHAAIGDVAARRRGLRCDDPLDLRATASGLVDRGVAALRRDAPRPPAEVTSE